MFKTYPKIIISLTILVNCLRISQSHSHSIRIFSLSGDGENSTKYLITNVTLSTKDNETKTEQIYNQNQNPTQSQIKTNEVDLVFGKNLQYLLCEANEPIEWVYAGGGRPSKIKEITARTEDNLVQSALHFNIENRKSGEYSEHTGSYVCRALKNKNFKTSVYLYFSDGPKVFLQENEIRDPLYLPSLGSGPTMPTEAGDSLPFIIPCIETNPNVTVTLYRKKKGKGKKLRLKPVEAKYNPKLGFALNLPKNRTKLNSLAGEYICVANTTQKNNATFEVHRPNPVTVKATPTESIVYIGKQLNFTCESTEPVLIRETESNLAMYDDGGEELDEIGTEDEIEETTEISATSLHVANHIDLNPLPGSYGVFQCQTDNDEKLVLHSWKYFVIGKEADELSGLKYNKKKQEFRCRSKSNQPGILSFIGCSTPSECAINRVCLEKWESCTGFNFPHQNPTRCKSPSKKTKSNEPCTKISYNGGSGFVRCVAEGIDEIREFNANGLVPKTTVLKNAKNDNITFNAYNTPTLVLNLIVNFNANDTRSLTGSSQPDLQSNFLTLDLTLGRSSYHFTGGHKWSILLQNGNSVNIVPESEIPDTHSSDLIRAVIKISNETFSQAAKIICKVPLRETMEWKNVSVTIEGGRGIIEKSENLSSSDEKITVTDANPDRNVTATDERENDDQDKDKFQDPEQDNIEKDPELEATTVATLIGQVQEGEINFEI